jgi:hypothetical protein
MYVPSENAIAFTRDESAFATAFGPDFAIPIVRDMSFVSFKCAHNHAAGYHRVSLRHLIEWPR